MKIFDASEIYQFAMRIEENGEKFYRRAAVVTEDENARYLFNFLADEEVGHKKIFSALLAKMEKYEPEERYPGEYMAYLRDYLDNKVIFSAKALNEEFCDIKDTVSALDFAINREVDSILYYSEAKNFVAKSQHEAIDKIIDEERKHFAKLTDFKKEYEKKQG
jgi:rubrerythrin